MHLKDDARQSTPDLAGGGLEAPPVPINGAVVYAYTDRPWLTGVDGGMVPAEVGAAVVLTASKGLPLFVEGR
jgi:hypothetical protein